MVEVLGGRAEQRGRHPSMYVVSTKTSGVKIDQQYIVKLIIKVFSKIYFQYGVSTIFFENVFVIFLPKKSSGKHPGRQKYP